MISDTPVHDWLRPRLAELVQQAERAGFLREAVVAVIMDLITAPPYDDAPCRRLNDQVTTRSAGRVLTARRRYRPR